MIRRKTGSTKTHLRSCRITLPTLSCLDLEIFQLRRYTWQPEITNVTSKMSIQKDQEPIVFLSRCRVMYSISSRHQLIRTRAAPDPLPCQSSSCQKTYSSRITYVSSSIFSAICASPVSLISCTDTYLLMSWRGMTFSLRTAVVPRLKT